LIDKLTLKAWSFDASAFETLPGAPDSRDLYYTTAARIARARSIPRVGVRCALTWSSTEFPENVSFMT